jgi:PKD repeat protein
MVNGLVKLDGSGSSDPDGYLTRYAWNFGDGTTAYGRIVYHKFVKVGTYKVTLIVTDNKGAKASDTAIVTIK